MLEFWAHDLIPVTFPSPLTSLVTRMTLGPQWVLRFARLTASRGAGVGIPAAGATCPGLLLYLRSTSPLELAPRPLPAP